MGNTKLIYGTYKTKERNRILEIFDELGVEYTASEHTHAHGANKRPEEKDVWCFYQLESTVTPEQEKRIRRKRDLLKKLYS